VLRNGVSLETNVLFDRLKHCSENMESCSASAVCAVTDCLRSKAQPLQAKHKKREEIEMDLTDPESPGSDPRSNRLASGVSLLEIPHRYSARSSTGKIMLDETPIGNFLEIEGSARWIDRTAKLLGFKHSDYLKASYGALYRVLPWKRVTSKTCCFDLDEYLRAASKITLVASKSCGAYSISGTLAVITT